jgi:ubiquinone/menaquinone biosynthesis C-methylase UbiE
MKEDTPSARDIFGSKADAYAGMDVFSEEKYYEPLLEMAAPAAGEVVLDIGAGTGLLALLLARKAAEVIALDVTPEMLLRAAERINAAGVRNISLIEAEASKLPFGDGVFDLVTSRTAFHHFTDPRKALSEIYRVLKPGGRLAIEDVIGPVDSRKRKVRERIEKLIDPSHVIAYTIPELRNMLQEAGLRVTGEISPETKGLPLDIFVKPERMDSIDGAAKLLHLLRNHINEDLGGFRIYEEGGLMTLQWQVFIITAQKPAAGFRRPSP